MGPLMIILIGSTKGGVGKSTVAVNLAAWLALGARVVLVDTDVQQHASDWAHDRAERSPALPSVAIAHAYGKRVPNVLEELATNYAMVVVDAGGRDSYELRGAARVADVMVSPVVASSFDMKGMRDTAELIEEASVFRGESFLALAVLNKVDGDKRLAADERRAREALSRWPQVRTMRAKLGRRRPFLLSIEDGRAAFEIERQRSAAGDEVAALWSEIEQHVEARRGTATVQH